MKKLSLFMLMSVMVVVLALSGCTSTSSPTTTAAPAPTATTPAAGQPVSGGMLMMAGSQTPKNIGYQPTMALIDKTLIFTTIAERLMNMNTKGELVPELATAVATDPAAKTITWTLRKGVKFHDGTDFNAKAAAWNFQQMKDAGVLQGGKTIANIETPDDYTLKFTVTEFSYQNVMAFSFNVFMLSPTLIQSAGKDGAITKVAGTGPFKLETFDPATKVVIAKNPSYWRTGLPYLDGITQLVNLDSAVLSAQIQSNEIQFLTSGDLVLQKNLVSKGFRQIVYTPNQTYTFLVPSSNDSTSVLSNPLVRQAIEYATDRAAICNGLLQGTSKAAYQMSYEGATGYDAARGRKYDVAKAKQLMEQAGLAGKPVNITIYGSNSKPSIDRRTAIADYLKEIGITAKVEGLPFASYSTMQAEGWKNGYMDCVENSGAVWAVGYCNWLGPKPTLSPVPSLGRSAEYDAIANKVLTAPDAATFNGLVTQLIQKNFDDAMTFPLWSQGNTYMAPSFVHTDKAEGTSRTFDWAQVWMEKK